MILPEVTTFFDFSGQNDQFRPRILEIITWYIKLKSINSKSLSKWFRPKIFIQRANTSKNQIFDNYHRWRHSIPFRSKMVSKLKSGTRGLNKSVLYNFITGRLSLNTIFTNHFLRSWWELGKNKKLDISSSNYVQWHILSRKNNKVRLWNGNVLILEKIICCPLRPIFEKMFPQDIVKARGMKLLV